VDSAGRPRETRLSSRPVEAERTTAAIQRYLDELAAAGDAPAEPIVRDLLARAARRLRLLCGSLLHRGYPRLARPPLNLEADEMLSAVVERLLKALRAARPRHVRQFFALANQHMRWELNDLARRLDEQGPRVALRDSQAVAPPPGDATAGPRARRILAAIDGLPEEEREAFSLARVQGLAHAEAAALLGVSTKTIQRRLQRAVVLLAASLAEMQASSASSASAGEG